jgi:hypothetical protein
VEEEQHSGKSGNCVEVADLGHAMAVRDSKESDGAVLVVASDQWQRLLVGLKNSR